MKTLENSDSTKKKAPVFLLELSQRYQGARRPGDVGYAPTEAERRSNLDNDGVRGPFLISQEPLPACVSGHAF